MDQVEFDEYMEGERRITYEFGDRSISKMKGKIRCGRFAGRSIAEVVRYAPDWIIEWYIPAMSGHDDEAVAEVQEIMNRQELTSAEEFDASVPVRH